VTRREQAEPQPMARNPACPGKVAPAQREHVAISFERVTLEAAKANHRMEPKAARGLSPCGNRAIPARAAELAPMVNGVVTGAPEQALIWASKIRDFSVMPLPRSGSGSGREASLCASRALDSGRTAHRMAGHGWGGAGHCGGDRRAPRALI
jgi:hypothetical protein